MQILLPYLLTALVIFQAFAIEYFLEKSCNNEVTTGYPLNYCTTGYAGSNSQGYRFKYKAVPSGNEISLNYTAFFNTDCSPGPESGPYTALTLDTSCQNKKDTTGKVANTFPPLSRGYRDIT